MRKSHFQIKGLDSPCLSLSPCPHEPRGGRTAYFPFKLTAYCLLLTAYFLISLPAVAQRNKASKPHHENLTEHRLQFPDVRDTVIVKGSVKIFDLLPATHSVNAQVDEVLDSIARFNKTKMFVDGFTIQIYAGLKREEAMKAKKKMLDELNELESDFSYQQPKFRVKTGNYFTRLEAQRDLHRVKRVFPNAILIPEKVPLR
jgi:SPOR domain